ncbi:hypothetical protein ACFVMC_15410 [Nocardia sp. NPDC127579]|uniref:hypothetical protein n=1 Tax=Nocardia sp. NPDC127579 TaxID=3345402 RepID=UPI0036426591
MYGNQGQFHGGQQPPHGYAPGPYQQPPYGAPYGPPPSGYPPPHGPQPNKYRALVIAAIVLVVVLGAVAVRAVATSNSDSPDRSNRPIATAPPPFSTVSPVTTIPKPWQGAYSVALVTDPCALLDPSVMARWSRTPKQAPQGEKEDALPSLGGGELQCNMSFEAEHTPGAVIVPPSLRITVNFAESCCDSAFYFTNRSESSVRVYGLDGGSHGPVEGLGEQAYFVTSKDLPGAPHYVTHELFVRDSNVFVKISAVVSSDTPFTNADLESAFHRQVRQILDQLRT